MDVAIHVWHYMDWYFAVLSKEQSKEIRSYFKKEERSWGRLPVHVILKENNWYTSMWFDTKLSTYLLPLKKEIRKQHAINEGDLLVLTISI